MYSYSTWYLMKLAIDDIVGSLYAKVTLLVEESVNYQLATNHISTACVVICLILLYLMYDTIR